MPALKCLSRIRLQLDNCVQPPPSKPGLPLCLPLDLHALPRPVQHCSTTLQFDIGLRSLMRPTRRSSCPSSPQDPQHPFACPQCEIACHTSFPHPPAADEPPPHPLAVCEPQLLQLTAARQGHDDLVQVGTPGGLEHAQAGLQCTGVAVHRRVAYGVHGLRARRLCWGLEVAEQLVLIFQQVGLCCNLGGMHVCAFAH